MCYISSGLPAFFFNLPFPDPGVVTHIGPCGLRVGTFLDLSFLVCIFPTS